MPSRLFPLPNGSVRLISRPFLLPRFICNSLVLRVKRGGMFRFLSFLCQGSCNTENRIYAESIYATFSEIVLITIVNSHRASYVACSRTAFQMGIVHPGSMSLRFSANVNHILSPLHTEVRVNGRDISDRPDFTGYSCCTGC